jgi:hypothetical protein
MSQIVASSSSTSESPFDGIRKVRPDGTEFWSARDLYPLLGYTKWQQFAESVLTRATQAMNNMNPALVATAFVQVTQLTAAGNLGTVEREDWELSRYAAYLVAMNGDPRKAEVAAAQSYFAQSTYKFETQAIEQLDDEAWALRYLDAVRERKKFALETAAAQAEAAVARCETDHALRHKKLHSGSHPVSAWSAHYALENGRINSDLVKLGYQVRVSHREIGLVREYAPTAEGLKWCRWSATRQDGGPKVEFLLWQKDLMDQIYCGE